MDLRTCYRCGLLGETAARYYCRHKFCDICFVAEPACYVCSAPDRAEIFTAECYYCAREFPSPKMHHHLSFVHRIIMAFRIVAYCRDNKSGKLIFYAGSTESL